MQILTRLPHEKQWSPTTKQEALRLISEEMPDTDPEGTLAYILSQIAKGKSVTLGECRFKFSNKKEIL